MNTKGGLLAGNLDVFSSSYHFAVLWAHLPWRSLFVGGQTSFPFEASWWNGHQSSYQDPWFLRDILGNWMNYQYMMHLLYREGGANEKTIQKRVTEDINVNCCQKQEETSIPHCLPGCQEHDVIWPMNSPLEAAPACLSGDKNNHRFSWHLLLLPSLSEPRLNGANLPMVVFMMWAGVIGDCSETIKFISIRSVT